jgi:hypothetical protein
MRNNGNYEENKESFMPYLFTIKCAIKVIQEPRSGSMYITAGGA